MARGRGQGGRQVVEGSGGEYARDSGGVFSFCLLALCLLIFHHFSTAQRLQINNWLNLQLILNTYYFYTNYFSGHEIKI
jgi:hypothetical protein